MDHAKPVCISKQDVWDAYTRVKANQGAAGVDGQSIEQFEKERKGSGCVGTKPEESRE